MQGVQPFLFGCGRAQKLPLLLRLYEFPESGRHGSTDEGSYNEYPKLAQGLTTFDESGAERTCRIYTGTGVVDTNKVNEDDALDANNVQANTEASSLEPVEHRRYSITTK